MNKKATLIELDKARNLKYDFNALELIEEHTGKNPLAKDAWTDMGPKQVKVFVWAGLIHEDEALTQKEVGAMLSIGNMEYVMGQIAVAWGVSMPEYKKALKVAQAEVENKKK